MNARVLYAALILLSSLPAYALEEGETANTLMSQEEIMDACHDMAIEDRIPAGEMDEYMKDCISAMESEEAAGDMESAPTDK